MTTRIAPAFVLVLLLAACDDRPGEAFEGSIGVYVRLGDEQIADAVPARIEGFRIDRGFGSYEVGGVDSAEDGWTRTRASFYATVVGVFSGPGEYPAEVEVVSWRSEGSGGDRHELEVAITGTADGCTMEIGDGDGEYGGVACDFVTAAVSILNPDDTDPEDGYVREGGLLSASWAGAWVPIGDADEEMSDDEAPQ